MMPQKRTDVTYSIDIWWKTGRSMRSDSGLTYTEAGRAAIEARKNAAIARVQLVRVVVEETIIVDWEAQ